MHRSPTPYRCAVYSVTVMGDRRQGHWRRGGGGGRCRRRDLLLDCWCVTENMVSESRQRQSDSERWEAMERDRRFHEKSLTSLLHVWPTYQWWQVRQSLSPYRVIKRISGQTGVSLSLYGSVAAAVTQGRCHVALHGRPSSSFDCQRRRSAAVTGSSETAYFGGWTKSLYFMTRV